MAASSKLVAASITYPYQVVRARLQVRTTLVINYKLNGRCICSEMNTCTFGESNTCGEMNTCGESMYMW